MFNYVLNFYIKNKDIIKIDNILTKINKGEFNIYDLDNINILKITKKFPDNYTATLEVNYDDFLDDLEFNVILKSPNNGYMQEVSNTNSFKSSYFLEGEDNLYSIYVFGEEDRFVIDNILDDVLIDKHNN